MTKVSENDDSHCAGTTKFAVTSGEKECLKRKAFRHPRKTDIEGADIMCRDKPRKWPVRQLAVYVCVFRYQNQISERCRVPCLYISDRQGITKVTKCRKYMNRQHRLKLVKISVVLSITAVS